MKKPMRKPMKRTELRRTSWMKRGTTPLAKRNATRQAKRDAAYQAYLQSPAWKAIRRAAIVRAGTRCEWTAAVRTPDGTELTVRCPVWHRLSVHHRTYARFGGAELPEDLQVLCLEHHRLVEQSKHSYRRHKSRSTRVSPDPGATDG